MTLRNLLIVGFLPCLSVLKGWGQASTGGNAALRANYELAQKYHDFTLGGKLSSNSMTLYPREINKTDNFWFDFTTSSGKTAVSFYS